MENFSITQLVPHRPPALLVQEILETFDGGLRTRVEWPADEASPFLLIEAAAQSVAAYQGRQKTLRSESTTEGFLVATRDFVFPEALPAGGTWSVRVSELKNLRPFYLFDAVILHDDRQLAAGTLTLYLPEAA